MCCGYSVGDRWLCRCGYEIMRGLVMPAKVDVGVYSDNVDVAHTEALCFSLRLTRKIGLSSQIVESDSLPVIQFVLAK